MWWGWWWGEGGKIWRKIETRTPAIHNWAGQPQWDSFRPGVEKVTIFCWCHEWMTPCKRYFWWEISFLVIKAAFRRRLFGNGSCSVLTKMSFDEDDKYIMINGETSKTVPNFLLNLFPRCFVYVDNTLHVELF